MGGPIDRMIPCVLLLHYCIRPLLSAARCSDVILKDHCNTILSTLVSLPLVVVIKTYLIWSEFNDHFSSRITTQHTFTAAHKSQSPLFPQSHHTGRIQFKGHQCYLITRWIQWCARSIKRIPRISPYLLIYILG